MKEKVIRLGVDLSLYLAESMFLLSDDIRTMIWFCAKLWTCVMPQPVQNHVLQRLLLVMHYVYSKHIQTMNRLFHDANGFSRETIESNIFFFWNSLFDDEAGEATSKVIRTRILTDLFTPILGKPYHSEIRALPPHSPYILGMDFVKQELKEEVVRLGVELSLYVAESMFLLSDDIRSILRFCLKLWRDAKGDVMMMIPDSPVVERLLGAIHYVYSKYIKPKHGVYHKNDGISVQWELIRTTWEDFDAAIRDLDRLVLILRGKGNCFHGREFTCRIEEALKKVDDKVRSAKAVSEAKGFARGA